MNWGDGSTGSATVTGSGGVFTVKGTHTYTTDSLGAPGGVDTATITFTGPNETTLNSSGNETFTATKAVKVVQPPITGYADQVLATGSTTFNGEVATFTEPDASDSSGDFAATIYWGDGTSSSGTVTGATGLFYVAASHIYNSAKNYVIDVVIDQTSSVALYLLSSAVVLPAADAEQPVLTVQTKGGTQTMEALSPDCAPCHFRDGN